MCELLLWATCAQSCGGPCKNPRGTHLRNVPVRDKELAIDPAISVTTLLPPHIWVMPEPDPAKSYGAEEAFPLRS